MEHLGQRISYNQEALHTAVSLLPCPTDKLCFFDIETTGLSPKVSSLYLIGISYLQGAQWHMEQWFADDYISEEEILRSFASSISHFETLIHYNGSTFDIPYLEKKYHAFHLPSPFADKANLDLYKIIQKRKNVFPAPNRKLSTMERLVGFIRHDTYSGKDCIQLYTDFMQKKYFRDPDAGAIKKRLLLHNHDDLIGTMLCSSFLLYMQYNPVCPSMKQQDMSLCFSDALTHPVPLPLAFDEKGVHYEYRQSEFWLTVPLFEGTLYHFFPDYENYYYLPKEDTAIHKSVGKYVAPAFREKAKASNCYIKKTGTFLPLPKGINWTAPIFKASRRDAKIYHSWTEDSTLSKDERIEILSGYTNVL